jgi:hypothetical protein
MVLSTGTTVKNVIQDSTQLHHVVIPKHADLGKGQYVILKTTHVVRINVKLRPLVSSAERLGILHVISLRLVMEVQPIVQRIKRRMMGLIVEMDCLVQVGFVPV